MKPQDFDFDAALTRIRDQPQSSFSRILFAAEEQFAKSDFASVGIRDIAGQAEINVSTLHFHWRNKETLYEGVCRYHASFLVEAVGPHLPSATLGVTEIRGAISALIGVLTSHPHIAPIALQSLSGKDPATLPNLIEHDVALYRKFAKQIGAVADEGSLAKQFPQLLVLNVLYSTLAMFVDTKQQQSQLGRSVYRSKALQKNMTDFACGLLDLALHKGGKK